MLTDMDRALLRRVATAHLTLVAGLRSLGATEEELVAVLEEIRAELPSVVLVGTRESMHGQLAGLVDSQLRSNS